MQGLFVPLAKALLSNQQAPCFYRFQSRQIQVTLFSDGPLPLGDPSGRFLGTTKEDVAQMLADSFLNPTNAVLEQNTGRAA